MLESIITNLVETTKDFVVKHNKEILLALKSVRL